MTNALVAPSNHPEHSSSHFLSSPSRHLTLQGLSEILKDLLNEGATKEALLVSRLPLELSCTHIEPTSRIKNAGRGLFASRDFDRGEILTCYAGDVLITASMDADDSETETIIWGAHVNETLRLDDNRLISTMSGYILQVSQDRAIAGLPLLDQDSAYLGQFANDGGRPPRCESQISSYVLESYELANAMHQPLLGCHMVTVATRSIREGEEILVTYGPEYWMEHADIWADDEDDDNYYDSIRQSNGKGFV